MSKILWSSTSGWTVDKIADVIKAFEANPSAHGISAVNALEAIKQILTDSGHVEDVA